MRVSIFGSSLAKSFEDEYKAAYDVSYKLSLSGFTIVNGGGKGIMEASSLGTNDAGGESIGIVLKSRKIETSFNTRIEVCNTLFERLRKLIMESDAYIFFKGGTGTLAEIGMVLDLINKGLIPIKKIVFYKDYWKCITNLVNKQATYQGERVSNFITFTDSSDKIVDIITNM